LKDMLTQLSAPKGAPVVMDAGIATDANLRWLRQEGYHYVGQDSAVDSSTTRKALKCKPQATRPSKFNA